MKSSPRPKTGRRTKALGPDARFAREALKRGLVNREQAEECVGAARALARQGKKVGVEEVFVRKGYLTRAQARGLAAAAAKLAPPLELVEEAERCPACGGDPGVGDDCRHCGADLETGAPGAGSVLCGACGQVLRKGRALCTRCAAPVHAPRRTARGLDVGDLLGKLALLLAVGGGVYFLIVRPLRAPPAPPAAEEEQPAVAAAAALLEQGDVAGARAALDRAAQDGGPAGDAAARALAYLERAHGRPDRAAAVTRRALARVDDPALRLYLVGLALDAGRLPEARSELQRVPEARRDDAWRRLDARRRIAAKEDPTPALAALEAPTAEEKTSLARRLAEKALALAPKDPAGATALAAKARNADPADGPTRLRCALVLLAQGKAAFAQPDIDAAVAALPEDPAAHLARGLVLEASGDRGGAAAAYREYLRLAPADDARRSKVEAKAEALER